LSLVARDVLQTGISAHLFFQVLAGAGRSAKMGLFKVKQFLLSALTIYCKFANQFEFWDSSGWPTTNLQSLSQLESQSLVLKKIN
jgi:hypothetical protein